MFGRYTRLLLRGDGQMTKIKGDGRSSRVRLRSLKLCLHVQERRDGRGLRAIGFDFSIHACE
jgi:hypothetical protein